MPLFTIAFCHTLQSAVQYIISCSLNFITSFLKDALAAVTFEESQDTTLIMDFNSNSSWLDNIWQTPIRQESQEVH